MSAGDVRALFLDRDGTLIRDVGYARAPESVELLPGVCGALRTASEAGFRLVIVSNQSGVGRGIIQRAEAEAVQARVEALFAVEGVSFAGAQFCFHAPDEGCRCRKPAPGMLLRAAADLRIDLARSIMVGDKQSDIEAGLAAGCSTILFGAGDPRANATMESWTELEALLSLRS